MASMRQVNHSWIARDIIGGNSALDLVNTVSGWGDDPEDWIPDVGSFLEWTHVSGLLNVHEKSKAVHQVAASPASAERVLASLKELRLLCGTSSIPWDTASEPGLIISRY